MAPVKFNSVISFSSEDPSFPSSNLLCEKKWKGKSTGEQREWVILQLEKTSQITAVDIGNEGSAFVEVLVGRTGMQDADYQVLLVSSSFMSPLDSRSNLNVSRVRMFQTDKLVATVSDEKWDRVKVVCTQPFNKHIKYGLSFIKLHATQATEVKLGAFTLKNDDHNSLEVGSLFSKRKEKTEHPAPLTGAVGMRVASSLAAAALATPHKRGLEDDVKLPRRDGTPGESSEKTTKHEQAHKKQKHSHDKHRTDTPAKPNTDTSKHSSDRDKHRESHDKHRNSHSSDKHKDSHSKDKDSHDRDKHRESHGNDRDKHRNSHSSDKHKDSHDRDKHKDSHDRDKHKDSHDRDKHKDSSKHGKYHNGKDHSSTNHGGKDSTNHVRMSGSGSKLLTDVKFVLSGYVNPARGEIRAKATHMGAKYYSEWGKHCTHLICAFKGTPKYKEVLGQGKIVTDKWILESYRDKCRQPWRRYRLDSGGKSDESGEEQEEITTHKDIQEEEVDSADEIDKLKNESVAAVASSGEDEYGGDTDVDEEDEVKPVNTHNIPLPKLPDVFHNLTFYITTNTSTNTTTHLTRYITACKGVIVENASSAQYIVYETWSKDLTQMCEEDVKLVDVEWVERCIHKLHMQP